MDEMSQPTDNRDQPVALKKEINFTAITLTDPDQTKADNDQTAPLHRQGTRNEQEPLEAGAQTSTEKKEDWDDDRDIKSADARDLDSAASSPRYFCFCSWNLV